MSVRGALIAVIGGAVSFVAAVQISAVTLPVNLSIPLLNFHCTPSVASLLASQSHGLYTVQAFVKPCVHSSQNGTSFIVKDAELSFIIFIISGEITYVWI